MSKKHQKHAKLTKPHLGQFGRNELAILGTPCGDIKRLTQDLTHGLAAQMSLAYIDADHKSPENEGITSPFLRNGGSFEYTDKIEFHQFNSISGQTEFQRRSIFSEYDLILVNGNHFVAQNQILVIDDRKSVEKKLDRLTDVVLILIQEGSHIPDFLPDAIDNFQNIPQLRFNDTQDIRSFIHDWHQSQIPAIKGLVLSGGKSERMQRDKTKIQYHGVYQRDHMLHLLSGITTEAFYSVRPDQIEDFNGENVIADRFFGLGPYGAVLSAMMEDPNAAWLVTAADQPFLNHRVLELLVEKRNPSKLATAFYNPETDFPEPLVTLWEPRAYPAMLNFLSLGFSCPRKVLINSDIELVKLDDASVLDNVNTPEEYELALDRIKL